MMQLVAFVFFVVVSLTSAASLPFKEDTPLRRTKRSAIPGADCFEVRPTNPYKQPFVICRPELNLPHSGGGGGGSYGPAAPAPASSAALSYAAAANVPLVSSSSAYKPPPGYSSVSHYSKPSSGYSHVSIPSSSAAASILAGQGFNNIAATLVTGQGGAGPYGSSSPQRPVYQRSDSEDLMESRDASGATPLLAAVDLEGDANQQMYIMEPVSDGQRSSDGDDDGEPHLFFVDDLESTMSPKSVYGGDVDAPHIHSQIIPYPDIGEHQTFVQADKLSYFANPNSVYFPPPQPVAHSPVTLSCQMHRSPYGPSAAAPFAIFQLYLKPKKLDLHGATHLPQTPQNYLNAYKTSEEGTQAQPKMENAQIPLNPTPPFDEGLTSFKQANDLNEAGAPPFVITNENTDKARFREFFTFLLNIIGRNKELRGGQHFIWPSDVQEEEDDDDDVFDENAKRLDAQDKKTDGNNQKLPEKMLQNNNNNNQEMMNAQKQQNLEENNNQQKQQQNAGEQFASQLSSVQESEKDWKQSLKNRPTMEMNSNQMAPPLIPPPPPQVQMQMQNPPINEHHQMMMNLNPNQLPIKANQMGPKSHEIPPNSPQGNQMQSFNQQQPPQENHMMNSNPPQNFIRGNQPPIKSNQMFDANLHKENPPQVNQMQSLNQQQPPQENSPNFQPPIKSNPPPLMGPNPKSHEENFPQMSISSNESPTTDPPNPGPNSQENLMIITSSPFPKSQEENLQNSANQNQQPPPQMFSPPPLGIQRNFPNFFGNQMLLSQTPKMFQQSRLLQDNQPQENRSNLGQMESLTLDGNSEQMQRQHQTFLQHPSLSAQESSQINFPKRNFQANLNQARQNLQQGSRVFTVMT